jgi:hypothetical protein
MKHIKLIFLGVIFVLTGCYFVIMQNKQIGIPFLFIGVFLEMYVVYNILIKK